MDVWKHGRYVDLWSLVHFLSGAALALLCYWLGYGFWIAFLISALLLAAWEVFEWVIGIVEGSPNVGADVAIGALGFLCAAGWYYGLRHPFDMTVLLALVAVVGTLSFWGFLDFYFRGYR